MGYNKAVLMGRLTATPELKRTNTGYAVTSFSIAVDRNFARQGEEKSVDFINIVAWRQTAEFICKWFVKGNMILIDGEIQTRNYEDKNGQKRIAFEVLANNVSFCGEKVTVPETVAAAQTETQTSIDDDSLPF